MSPRGSLYDGHISEWQVVSKRSYHGPLPLYSTGRHGHFLKSTCDMELSDMRKNIRDMTWDIS